MDFRYAFRILLLGFCLLNHIQVVKSFFRGTTEYAEFSPDTIKSLSSLKVLELLAPERQMLTDEIQHQVIRSHLPRRAFGDYKKLAGMIPRRTLPESLKALSRIIDSIKIRNVQKVAIIEGISIALKALEQDRLPITERIWTLALLDGLRAYLPDRELMIRTNIANGPVFRGALELHLTQGIDLLSISRTILQDPLAQRETQHVLAEAFGRSKVLFKIKDELQEHHFELPEKFSRLYDTLSKASFPVTKQDELALIVNCVEPLLTDYRPPNTHVSTACYNMLNHFMRHDQNIMSLISSRLLSFPSGDWEHKQFMHFSVMVDIPFLLLGRRDRHLDNLMDPFRDESTLSNFQHAISTLKAQELAIENKKQLEYDLPSSHLQEYLMETHSLLHTIYRCSLYKPPEVSNYLFNEMAFLGDRLTFRVHINERIHQLVNIGPILQYLPSASQASLELGDRLTYKVHIKENIHQSVDIGSSSGHTGSTLQYLPSTSQESLGPVEKEREQCPTCLDEFEAGHRVYKLPCSKDVSHFFHQHCLEPWYAKHDTCPMCRTKIQPIGFKSRLFWFESLSKQSETKKTEDDDHK